MCILLLCVAALAFLLGFGTCVFEEGVFQQIEGLILICISAICFVGAAIVATIKNTQARASALPTKRSLQPGPPPLTAEPAGSPPPVASYYFSADGKDIGPYSLAEMRTLRKVGRIQDGTLVFRLGETEWRPAQAFTEITSEES